MAKRRPVTLAGLDIGTSKTAVIIAQASSGSPQIMGLAETPSIGVTKGCITSPEAASKAILQALEQAQRGAGASKPSTVYVSFNGGTTTVKNCLLNLKPGRYSASRSNHIGLPAVPVGLAEGDSALQLIPPRELPGRSVFEVEAGARVVTAPTYNIKDISRAVHLAGLKVDDVVFGPVAAAEVLLTQAEKEFGTILIDIGAGTTSVSIFNLGELRETVVFPVGGEHLVSDLAIGLHISLNQAVETLCGYELSGTGDDNKLDLAKSIIEARLSEILYLTGSIIKNFQYPGLLPGGAVFSGGVTLLGGFAPFAENILKLPVRIGNIQVNGHPLSLTLANALGLVKYGTQRLTGPGLRLTANCEPEALMSKLIKWLQGRMKNGSRL
ncbi:MAG: cell division FtsA domain-containing protein [Desulfotomaculaceae bacterium]|nr:cell division FtsA domain-containing protein [Desulfotomaculaceae bacterium]